MRTELDERHPPGSRLQERLPVCPLSDRPAVHGTLWVPVSGSFHTASLAVATVLVAACVGDSERAGESAL